jgi:hypothetical protein
MDLRGALKDQYHGGLAMLAECVERCPDDLWAAPNPAVAVPTAGEWGGVERSFWRIAFHNAYFTHLYLGQGEAAFQPAPDGSGVRRMEFEGMWQAPWDLEPYELPVKTEPCRPGEILAYIAYVNGIVDSTVEGLDLDTDQSGFAWYKNITKLSHQLMNLRHLQGHVGQLSELLMLRGIDTDWHAK